MSITIKDIAKHAGVSYSTVSKALRNSPLVKDPTKKKIIKIAEELGYVPNIAARSLVQKRSYTIGVVWPTVERVAPSALITIINDMLENHSYTTLLSINKIDSAISTFNRFQVDAVVVFADNESDVSQAEKYHSTVPILYYGINANSEYPTIDVNRRLAVGLAVEHLTSLGHKNISYIGEISTKDPLQKEKYIGYVEAMEANNLPIQPNMVIPTKGLDVYDGYLGAKSLFQDSEDVTAIISGSYDLTRGILRATQELNINVPSGLSIISYDNIPQTENLDVQFTKVGVPLNRIAQKITETILDIIEEKEINEAIILEPEINISDSCAPPRRNEKLIKE
ncbi:LacI family DNA-binding transcriptional regulator [Anaerobacillus sp. CMMVII]|uniref:LacI family DNA-binding transcriptional regulator n=1 Tax=Anaerobacillus sp. CMMVII TaxID=2755588 RepID=UPI0021B7620B|nr:LacI family DNA-binding transcriptional regulator [Anaerobacillus sp. CMMVII]MCT8139597.1 LacI family DNA-binding transcriptional regulator [Anaerobacillus sp. CMMVII]